MLGRDLRNPTAREAILLLGNLHAHRDSPQPQHAELDERRFRQYYLLSNVMGAVMESAITSKGQATIPKAIRDHLRLKPGDRVKFFLHPDGSVVLLPKLPASALRGIIAPRHRPVTIDEMTEAAAAGATEADRRAKRR